MPAKNNAPQFITWKGKTQTIAAWAAEVGVSEQTLRARLGRLGWTVDRTLSAPADRRFSRSPGRPQANSPRSPPKLRKHAGGQAYVRWMEGGKRKQKWFGPWRSSKAREGYARFLRAWSEGVAESRPVPVAAGGVAVVADLARAWLGHCQTRYVKFGKQTSEFHVCRAAAAVAMDRFELLPVAEFGLMQLEAVRADMVKKNWARGTVNKYTGKVTAMFGWGVPRKLVPADVHYALLQIEPLTPGATTAPDSEPTRSVPPADLAAVLAGEHLHPDPDRRATLAAMIRVQLLTGMRPGELCALAPAHLDRSLSEWRYTIPATANKNHHRGKQPPAWFGPLAQAILSPLLAATAATSDRPLFTFPPIRRKADGPRPVSRHEYARLIHAACLRAGVAPWHPHQIRHNKATDVMRIYESDTDAARAIRTTPEVAARIYADPHEEAARRIARATG